MRKHTGIRPLQEGLGKRNMKQNHPPHFDEAKRVEVIEPKGQLRSTRKNVKGRAMLLDDPPASATTGSQLTGSRFAMSNTCFLIRAWGQTKSWHDYRKYIYIYIHVLFVYAF